MKRRFLATLLCSYLLIASLACSEGLLPTLTSAYGVAMPSLTDVLHRYPESEETVDGAAVEHWVSITDDDFNTFGIYLKEGGATLQDYRVEGSVFTATVAKSGRTFSFVFDTGAETADVTYPAGTYDERLFAIKSVYQQAKALMVKGDYIGALSAFSEISGYKDVDSLLRNDQNLSATATAVAAAREAKLVQFRSVGGYVTFGHYPQTKEENDSTPIEWLVLDYDAENNRALLLSRYGLDAQPYNTGRSYTSWKECPLRTWLNDTFLNKAFTIQEQEGILMANVANNRWQGYSKWSSSDWENTQDRVFLLSYAEANKYLGVKYADSKNIKSIVAPTEYAIKQRAWTSSRNKTADGSAAGWWWLRSPGEDSQHTACVNDKGSLISDVNRDKFCCIRPSLWINLESDIF